MHLLSEIPNRLFDTARRTVISNCSALTRKISEFLKHHLKLVIQEGQLYIKDTRDFLNKIKNINIINIIHII